METKAKLGAADRDFFQTIFETAFCNPFSEERTALDAKIVGHAIQPFAESHLDEMTRTISGQVQKLEAQGLADVRQFPAEDRALMQTVFLFEIYHLHYQDFDQLILDQLRLGVQSAPAPFASDALAQMKRRGINAGDAARFFGIFYQLRRAFHFIVRGLVGKSACMSELRRHLWNNVFTQDVRLYDRYLWNRMEDFSTLLLGETGSGKGAAAAAIGRSGYIPFDERSGRFAESFLRGFIAINLSQFPETLIESELFGHRKGAFTGAIEGHEGVLARCSSHGAIFLDEIGDVSVPVQIKLLQVLQERTFSPVGSHESVRFRGRVIAATNRSLEDLRRRRLFRDDFFYRLCSDEIRVPPLRQRFREEPGELHELLTHVVTAMVGEPAPELVSQVEETLRRNVNETYSWPGNVRELEQAVRRILVTGHYTGSSPARAGGVLDELVTGVEAESLDADGLLAGYCALLYESSGNYEDVARKTNLDRRTAKKYVQEGLNRVGANR
jgi:DNA-binding NtrC family response regulator